MKGDHDQDQVYFLMLRLFSVTLLLFLALPLSLECKTGLIAREEQICRADHLVLVALVRNALLYYSYKY